MPERRGKTYTYILRFILRRVFFDTNLTTVNV